MTLIDNYVDNDGGREYVLLKYTKMRRESQRTCEAWRTARAAQVRSVAARHRIPNQLWVFDLIHT